MAQIDLQPLPLAIVGASARAAAASAARAGFQPITADLFADVDLRRIATATRISPYPEGLLDWLRAIEPPAWMYTGALENYPELIDQLAWIAPLWGNPGDVLARVRNPFVVGAALRGAGLLFPDILASAEGLPRDGSWLVKAYRGASGSGVRAWDGESKLDAPHYFQKRVPGVPYSAVYVANGGGGSTIFGVSKQIVGEEWMGAGGFQFAGAICSGPVSILTMPSIIRIGEVLARQFGLLGLFGVDFIIDNEDVWTIEVNPRYTASTEIVERCLGISVVAAHVAACGEQPIQQPSDVVASRTPSHGKAILFAKRPVTLSEAFVDWAIGETLAEPWPKLADVSPAGARIAAGRPIITVFSDGADVSEVEKGLHQRVAEVEAALR